MTTTKVKVIDADGHLMEPRDLWEKNVPAKFRDLTIKVTWNEAKQLEETYLGGELAQFFAMNNGMARQPASVRENPVGWRWEDGPPAGLDGKARVVELDREAIDTTILYPSLGLILGGIEDPEHAVAACRAYNDWLAEFCSIAPDRLKGIAALPLQDPAASVAEARRAADQGHIGFFARPNPYNGKALHDAVFDPVWRALEEMGMPLGLHPSGTREITSAAQTYKPFWGPEYVYVGKPMHFLVDDIMTLSMMVGTGMLERFPKLQVVVLEAGGGWLPHWLDKMDHWLDVIGYQVKHLSLKPSEYFQRQVWVSFDPDESTLPITIQYLGGAHHLLWASDFPHMDVTSPSITEELYEHLKGIDEASQAQIIGENAQALYKL